MTILDKGIQAWEGREVRILLTNDTILDQATEALGVNLSNVETWRLMSVDQLGIHVTTMTATNTASQVFFPWAVIGSVVLAANQAGLTTSRAAS